MLLFATTLSLSTIFYEAEECDLDCNTTVWILTYAGEKVYGLPDMTEGECSDILTQVSPEVPELACEEVAVKRQQI